MDTQWNPKSSLGGLLIQAGNIIFNRGREHFRIRSLAHLSHGGVFVLTELKNTPQTQAQLCSTLGQRPPSMMEMLQRLKRNKLISSKRDSQDGRKILWRITPKGIQEWNLAKIVVREGIGRELDGFFEQKGWKKKQISELKIILQDLCSYLSNQKGELK